MKETTQLSCTLIHIVTTVQVCTSLSSTSLLSLLIPVISQSYFYIPLSGDIKHGSYMLGYPSGQGHITILSFQVHSPAPTTPFLFLLLAILLLHMPNRNLEQQQLVNSLPFTFPHLFWIFCHSKPVHTLSSTITYLLDTASATPNTLPCTLTHSFGMLSINKLMTFHPHSFFWILLQPSS